MRGVRLDLKKEMSLSDEIVDVSDVNKVYVPLMNMNIECECTVKKGKKVKKGSVIGIRKDIDFPIVSPVSGSVCDIKTCTYINGETVPCVVIENDKKETSLSKKKVDDITKYTKEEFIELLRKCSVIGMGGSGFPTFLKYKYDLNTLIVNAVECEPYLTSDALVSKLKSDIILETIDAIMKINNISKSYIVCKKDNDFVINAFENISKYENIELKLVKNIYPMGWERYVIKNTLNIEYENYPSEKGIVVNNVSTIFAIYKSLKYNRCISKRIVTVSGEGFTSPINILARIGSKMSNNVKKIGKYKGMELKFIAGGPMMGESCESDNLVVTQNLSGCVVLEKEDEEINECMNCGRCINVCPARLCPVFILNNINNIDKLKSLHPEKCIECGLCSYICPSKIGLREGVKFAKKKVKE